MSERRIGEYMTEGVFTIGREQTLHVAMQKMEEHRVRHLPVLHGGQLVGVLSLSDIEFIGSLNRLPLDSLIAEDAMSQEVYKVEREASLTCVAKHMHEHRLGSAIVTERDKPVGIFTTVDALRALAES